MPTGKRSASLVGHRSRASRCSQSGHPAVTIPPLDSNVWDNIYEIGQDEEDEEPHGSVIVHLLSQLKPGMDLTKVVLPTWILERRSLLEMFADFFVHPDEFIKIAHETSPERRMIQCLRWYLSSFHAGRPSDIAKKPYNPVIGETFSCWMTPKRDFEFAKASEDLAGPQSQAPQNKVGVTKPEDLTRAREGGVTKPEDLVRARASICAKAAPSDLSFIAEQVSHRPPISCFYTESLADKISMTSHIWTKSHYYGLSIAMECVGKGTIRLHDLDEDYVITFPKAYGRSILTTPWFEMGGHCKIICAKTGYSAKVDFHEKPLIGGYKHRITAEIKAPDETKPILLVRRLKGYGMTRC